MLLHTAMRARHPFAGLVFCALLAGCVTQSDPSVGPGGDLAPARASSSNLPLGPAVPVDDRSHAMFQALTGINGDAVASVQIGTPLSYVWFDGAAANPQRVAEAPVRMCTARGSLVKSTYITQPKDNTPGVKVLVIECLT
ncbi:hypothetical protein [uncultured Thioclava sp.]|uniref:hypothetical protein n=1 Tax=uncultured Thioclava sp. TaxID=473858 RepID=UPI0025CF164A|nr:hypothetical protein [uncultured Thioclava sp.]